ANATGTITFKLFADNNGACGAQLGSSVVTVNNGGNNKSYGSGAPSAGTFTVSAAGTYHWTADYSGDANNVPASSGCGGLNENPQVNKRPTSITTDSRNPNSADSSFTLGANGTATLADTATLSGGTSNATGTITFHLFADDGNGGCGNQLGSSTVNV